jgi:tRNA nucleotidyltransferase/poly(A) polymerase
MAVDLHGDIDQLIDPLGGESDLNQKLLRRCTVSSMAHDAIRTLRAVRQGIQLGLRIEAETLRDIRAYAPKLSQASPERVRDELFNVLALSKAGTALRIMEKSGLLPYIIPEYSTLVQWHATNPEAWALKVSIVERLGDVFSVISPNRTDNSAASFSLGMIAIQLDRYRSQFIEHLNSVWANERPYRALIVLGVLLHGLMHTEAALEGLRLSNPERQRLLLLMKNALPYEELTPLVIHRFWRRNAAAGIDLCLFALAQHLAQAGAELNQDDWLRLIERVQRLLEAYFEHYQQLVEPPILLNGEQLMHALGLKPGPMIGKLLEAIREAQVMGEVTTVEDAVQFARTRYGQE